MIFLFLLLLQNSLYCNSISDTSVSDDVLEIRMPGVRVPQDDTYYHLQTPLTNRAYITSYRAEAHSGVVHHLLLYGCSAVRDSKVWTGGVPCQEGAKILWAWALDAPQFYMPDNVTMEIGTAEIRYLVLEIHYKLKQAEDYRDVSGVDVHFVRERSKYQAGIYLMMVNSGSLPPYKSRISLDLTCNYTTPEINVFAYRTHAHTYAKMISGYREVNSTWTTIGARDPNLSEMFVRTETVTVVHPGDVLHARCEYDTTTTNKTVVIGNTHHDEMCNLYLMYYTDVGHIAQIEQGCTIQQHFVLPKDQVLWYEEYVSSRTLLYLFMCIIAVLVAGPAYACCRSCCCPKKSYYKRPNDGFEKLFGPDDDEEEDEILYKSYKNSY